MVFLKLPIWFIGIFTFTTIQMVVAAQNQKPEESELHYFIRKEHVVPGHTVHLLKYGALIGELKGGKPPELPKKPETSNPNLRYAQELIQYANRLADLDAIRIQGNIQDAKTFISNHLVNKEPHSEKQASAGSPHLLTKGKPQQLNFDLFVRCAKDTLPLLKQVYRLQMTLQRSEQEKDLLAILIETVDENRANGVERSPLGLICGKFLGTLGGNSASALEDIKFVMAIISRAASREDLEQLIETATVSYHPHSEVRVKGFWKRLWEYLSVQAVFSKEPLLSWNKIIESIQTSSLKTTLSTGLNGGSSEWVVKFNKEEINEYFEMGKHFLEKLKAENKELSK